MKLKTHKSELKLNKTEKSEVKTTARKQFVKNTIKDGIKKTDDPMEKEMVQGLMVAGYVTSKGARIGVKAVKQVCQCCQSTSDQELWQLLHPQSQIRPC